MRDALPSARLSCILRLALALDAPSAHVVQGAFTESGLSSHTAAEVRMVLGMD